MDAAEGASVVDGARSAQDRWGDGVGGATKINEDKYCAADDKENKQREVNKQRLEQPQVLRLLCSQSARAASLRMTLQMGNKREQKQTTAKAGTTAEAGPPLREG